MTKILITIAVVLALTATAVTVFRQAGMQLPWESSICGDPTAQCWTYGKPTYIAQIKRSMTDTRPTAASDKIVTTRILNTGPAIPRLFAAFKEGNDGKLRWIRATLATTDGTHTVHPLLISRRNHTLVWRMGAVPAGTILTIRSRCTPYATDISWMQPLLFVHWPLMPVPSAEVDTSNVLLQDPAALKS